MAFIHNYIKLRILPLSILLFGIIFVQSVASCVCSSAKINTQFYTDSLYTDSFGCNGHSYIRFRVPHTSDFQIVHNPDCYCRYHRTFVVIKKNK